MPECLDSIAKRVYFLGNLCQLRESEETSLKSKMFSIPTTLDAPTGIHYSSGAP